MSHHDKPSPPERIFLQHDPEDTGGPFSITPDVTWSKDRIFDNDAEYVRADVAARSAIGQTPVAYLITKRISGERRLAFADPEPELKSETCVPLFASAPTEIESTKMAMPADYEAQPCCGKFEGCMRACVPRGIWIGERKARAEERRSSWVPCAVELPEIGRNVLVYLPQSGSDRTPKVKALARFIPYEGAPDDHGHWDNHYPGSGNMHVFEAVTHWMPLPDGPSA